MSFGENLKKIRSEKQLSQKELAMLIGVSRQAIAAYETDSREPKFSLLIQIADAFNVSTDYLLGRTKFSGRMGFEFVSKNIRKIMGNFSVDAFAKVVGEKTGILIPPHKIKALIEGSLLPDNITLKIFAMYAEVETEYFYRMNE